MLLTYQPLPLTLKSLKNKKNKISKKKTKINCKENKITAQKLNTKYYESVCLGDARVWSGGMNRKKSENIQVTTSVLLWCWEKSLNHCGL